MERGAKEKARGCPKDVMSMMRHNKKGFVFIWFYLVSMFLIIMSAALLALMAQEMKLNAIDIAQEQAFWLAEGGLDRKLAELRQGNLASIPSTAMGDGTYQVTFCPRSVTAVPPCFPNQVDQIKSTGTVNGQSRQLIMAVNKVTIPPGVRAAVTVAGNGDAPFDFRGGVIIASMAATTM